MATEYSKIRIEDPILQKPFALIPGAVLERSDLSQGAKLAFAMLVFYQHKYGGYPGHEQMGNDLGVRRETISTYLRDLQKANLVTVERPGLGKTNVYTVKSLSPDVSSTARPDVSSTAHQPLDTAHTSMVDTSLKQDETKAFSSLINQLWQEFAPQDNERAIQTYLQRFPPALILRAAEITRASSNAKVPIAYLYGVLGRLVEQEGYLPAAQQQVPDLPQLTDEEYQVSLQALERVKKQLSQGG